LLLLLPLLPAAVHAEIAATEILQRRHRHLWPWLKVVLSMIAGVVFLFWVGGF